MLRLTEELLVKAKEAKSVEELLVLAKDHNIELTEEEAEGYFLQLNPKAGKLADEELDNVAGGACGKPKPRSCPTCGSTDLEDEGLYYGHKKNVKEGVKGDVVSALCVRHFYCNNCGHIFRG